MDVAPLSSADDAARLFALAFARTTAEIVQVALLDGGRRVLALEQVATGDGASVDLPLRPIMTRALALDARAIILAHNHPGSDPYPSQADLRSTRALVEVARPLGIEVTDHLIFAGDACASFRQLGLL